MGFSLKKLGKEFSRPFKKAGREVGRVLEKDIGIKGAQKAGEKVGGFYGDLVGGKTLASTYDKIGQGAESLVSGLAGEKLGGMVGGAISSPYNMGETYQDKALLEAEAAAAGGGGGIGAPLGPGAGGGGLTTGGLMQAQAQMASAQQGLDQQGGAGTVSIGQPQGSPSGTKLQQIAQQMADNYGLQTGGKPIVDASGNMNYMPQNADQAVAMQAISQAVANEQTRAAQNRAVAAIQAGFGQFSKRGPGSLMVLQSGLYENLANMYANEEYHAADFGYFIEKEAQERQAALLRQQKKEADRKGNLSGILGVAGAVVGFKFGGLAGAQAGYQIGTGAGGLF